ncbi:zinc finger BED domain-containing protein RICESLEEPER 1-like isoform X2, partial [Aphis craccivora]
VLKVLKRYDIRPDQVYSCTVDNGANMVKMVRLLAEDNENDVQEHNTGEIDEDSNDEDGDTDVLANNQYSFENETLNDNFQEDLVNSFTSTGFGMTFCIRCSAHTIQLCVFDGLKTTNLKVILEKARKIVIQGGTQFIICLIFCELTANDHCIPELELNNDDWELIKSLVLTLEPVQIGSKILQKADLTIGDFYGCWWKVRNGLSKVNTELSKAIQASMIKRQKTLMFNDIFVSAIYMDPRFQILLVPEFKKKAQDHICKLWSLICALKNIGRPQEVCTINEPENVTMVAISITTNSTILQPNICAIVTSYDGVQRIPYESDIREYWSLKEKEMPELYEISQILMSIPATQVSVERTFSTLKFILSDLRGNLSPALLESILIIKCNTQFRLAALNI